MLHLAFNKYRTTRIRYYEHKIAEVKKSLATLKDHLKLLHDQLYSQKHNHGPCIFAIAKTIRSILYTQKLIKELEWKVRYIS